MIAAKMGYEKQFAWKSAKEIFEEIAKVTPSYAGMTYERLNQQEALHWPCPSADHPGTPILHKEKFAHPDGLGQFFTGLRRGSPRQRSRTRNTRSSLPPAAACGTGTPGP